MFSFGAGAITSGAGTADNATVGTGGFMAILGGTSTQMSFVDEVYLGGEAASTAPHIMHLARSSAVATTPTALAANSGNSFGLLNPSGGVLTSVPTAFVAAATGSTRSGTVTLARKVFAYNAFGGIVRANYANTQDRFGILGNTASLGEFTLSAFTGTTTAAYGGHIILEVM
jgi:hypothetical protein